jgi:hypothetical protein
MFSKRPKIILGFILIYFLMLGMTFNPAKSQERVTLESTPDIENILRMIQR